MAVAFDAVGPASGTAAESTTSPLTWTHVSGANASAILISVTTGNGSSNLVTGVTYGGVACTLISPFVVSGNLTAGGIAVWYLANPPTGSNSVDVTFTGADVMIGGSVSATGSGGFNPSIATANPVGATSPTLSVSGTTAGGLICAAACFGGGVGGGVFSGTNSVTVRYALSQDATTAADNSVGGTVASAGGSQTVGFTTTASADDWGLIAVELVPAWSFVGTKNTDTASGTSFTVTLPAGVQGGDLIVVSFPYANTTAPGSVSLPGFTTIQNAPGNVKSGATNTFGNNFYSGYRVAGGTVGSATTDTTFTATFTSTSWCESVTTVLRPVGGFHLVGSAEYHAAAGFVTALPDATYTPASSRNATVWGYAGQASGVAGTETLSGTGVTALANFVQATSTVNGGVVGQGWLQSTSAPGGATSSVAIDPTNFVAEFANGSGSTPYTGTNGELGTQAIPGHAQPGNFIPGQVQPSTVSVNVTGVAAAVTVAGGVGTPGAGAALTGIAAAVTVAGGVGTPAGKANVTGVSAPVVVAGGTGTLTAGVAVTGVAAAVTAAGGVGTPAGAASTTGVAAPVTVTGGTGTFAGNANVTGVAAAVAVAGGVGTLTAGASLTGVAAAVTVAGGAGTPAGNANVTGVAAAVAVAGGIGTPQGGGTVNIAGVSAPVTAAGGVGTPAAGAALTGVSAPVTVAGGVGTPAGNANVTGVAAAVAVAGGIGTPAAGVAITGAAGLVTVAGGVGTPAGAASVTGVAAAVVVAGGIGTPAGKANVTGVSGPVVVAGGVGTFAGNANVTGVAALVTIAGGAGTPKAGVALTGVSALVIIAGGAGATFGGGGRGPQALGGTPSVVSPDTTSGGSASLAVNYGGTVSEVTYGGSGGHVVSLDAASGGNATVVSLDVTSGGTETTASLGGTVTYGNTLGGTATGWTMQQVSIQLAENNDETVDFALTSGGSALNLTGATVNMYLKTAAGTPDGSALVLSSAGGSPAITVTNAAGGLIAVAIPHADLAAETYTFYRVDVVFSGLQNTCVYGPVTWVTL